MAGSLRELVATFGIQFDPSGAKKADQALDKLGAKAKGQVAGTVVQSAQAATAQTNVLGNAIRNLGLIVAAREVARGFGYIVTSASDADETLNVLQASFGNSTQGVLDFAERTAEEVGRSEFVIRDFAGRIGALVAPAFANMGDAGEEQTARISSDFSKLAIDLASFFNKTEEEAITALRSGVSGESEPLKQFGVDLTEQGIADSLGIDKKGIAKMDRAQKTLARHRAIMIQTANAQGDAARTAEGFANMSRAVGSAVLDTATSIGRKILPAVETLTRFTRDAIRWFGDLVKHTHLVESALLTAAGAAVWFGGKALWAARRTVMAWAAALWPFALAILIIDEVWTTLSGGESLIRDLLVWFLGSEEAADAFLTAVKDGAVAAWNAMVNGISSAWSSLKAFWASLVSGVQTAWEHVSMFLQAWSDGFQEILKSPWIQEFIASYTEGIAILSGMVDRFVDNWKLGFDTLKGLAQPIIDLWFDGFNILVEKLSKLFDTFVADWKLGFDTLLPDWIRDSVANIEVGWDILGELGSKVAEGAGLSSQEADRRVNASIGQSGPTTTNMSMPITINTSGGNARDIGREAEKGVRKALNEDRRKVTNAVGG